MKITHDHNNPNLLQPESIMVLIPPSYDLNQPIPDGNAIESDEQTEILQLLAKAKVHPQDNPPPNEIVVEVIENDESSPLCTLGNFSMAIGKAKSKKTFLISLMLGIAAKGETMYDRFKGSLPAAKKHVAFFDTEQGKYHVHRVVVRVCKLIGIELPTNFETFGLRSFATEMRRSMVEAYIKKTPALGFLVIDGIRDLVKDINDPAEATDITGWLMRLTEEYGIHILVVLRQNKGDLNARGHLGTELTNKAETVLSVTKDSNNPKVSQVQAEFCRDREFSPFGIYVDSDGLPALADVHQSENKKVKKAKIPVNYPPEFHSRLVKKIFEKETQFKHGDLNRRTQIALQEMIGEVGESKAKNFVEFLLHNDLIKKEGKDRSPKSFYTLP